MNGGRPYEPLGSGVHAPDRVVPEGQDGPPSEISSGLSCPSGGDGSQLVLPETSHLEVRRLCEWCGGPLPDGCRRDRRTCSTPCRQAKARFAVAPAASTADRPRRFAYADPPYPGCARRYYNCDEVDHAELISRLFDEYPDGWALSTSAEALPEVLAIVTDAMRTLRREGCKLAELRVCPWVRGARKVRAYRPRNAWEPLIVYGGRPRLYGPEHDSCDVLVWGGRQHSHPGALVGMKPAPFAEWLFVQLGAALGDELVDLFPGSGAIGRAWALFVASDVVTEAVAEDLRDSFPEASRAAADDGFELVGDFVRDEDMHLFLLPEERPPLRSRLTEANANLRASLGDGEGSSE